MSSRRDFLRKSGMVAAAIPLLSWSEQGTSRTKVLPPKLEPGSKVAVVAPGGAIFNQSYIERFKETLLALGYSPVIGKSCTTQHGQFSAHEEVRAEEFMRFVKNESIKAIIGMRGGSGCARMLPFLDYEAIRQNPTIVMGFSDITSLINAIYTKSGVICYHGPVGYSTWNDFSTRAFNKVCIKGLPHEVINHPSTRRKTIRGGQAQGQLIGGNLMVFSNLIGTEYMPNPRGKILFLEEIDEEPYAIDRLLTQLKQAKILTRVSGIILGNFKRCEPEEPERSFSLQETFDNNLKNLGIPVYQGGDFGHTLNKWTLPVGAMASMDASTHRLEILEQTVI